MGFTSFVFFIVIQQIRFYNISMTLKGWIIFYQDIISIRLEENRIRIESKKRKFWLVLFFLRTLNPLSHPNFSICANLKRIEIKKSFCLSDCWNVLNYPKYVSISNSRAKIIENWIELNWDTLMHQEHQTNEFMMRCLTLANRQYMWWTIENWELFILF